MCIRLQTSLRDIQIFEYYFLTKKHLKRLKDQQKYDQIEVQECSYFFLCQ